MHKPFSIDDIRSQTNRLRQTRRTILAPMFLISSIAQACGGYFAPDASYGVFSTPDAACRNWFPKSHYDALGYRYDHAELTQYGGFVCKYRSGAQVIDGQYGSYSTNLCAVDPPVAPPATATTSTQPGNSCTSAGLYMGNPVSPASGEKVQSESDWQGTGAHALSFVRTYRSNWADMVPAAGLGSIWNHEHVIQFTANGDFAVVQFGDGSLRRFSRVDATSPWQIDAGSDALGTNATGWTYTRTEDDLVFQFNTSGQLLTQTQKNGWVKTYTYNASNQLSQVSNHFGRTLTFAYNAAGQLTSVTSPDNQVIQYEYDSSGRLSLVRNADNTTKTYTYSLVDFPNALTSITDENNNLYASFAYDSIARAISTEHAGGTNKFQVTYTSTNMADPVQVQDPLGTTRNFSYSYQGSKLAVTSADIPSGGGWAEAAARVQNTDGTLASETDYQGNQTQYTWDPVRRLPLSTTRAATTGIAQTNSTQWHPTLALKTKVATPGRITTYVYNGQPDPFNSGALAACAPATALLPNGSKIAVLCKQVEQATTDASGAAGFGAALQSGVPVRVSSWTYNAAAQVLTSIDALGHTSTNVYYTDTTATHRVGDLQSSSNALGHVTQFNQYNAAGNLLQSTDPNGLVSTNVYDARQRLTSTTAGGLTTTRTYTPSGQPKRVTQADGSYVNYTYDAAQRLTLVADSLGNSISYTLDNAGNRTADQVKDPSGTLARQVSRLFDELGRQQKTIGVE